MVGFLFIRLNFTCSPKFRRKLRRAGIKFERKRKAQSAKLKSLNYKFQITNHKQIPNSKFQIQKFIYFVLNFEHLNFDIVCNL